MPALFLLLSTALAAEPAFYHPDDVAAQSLVFGQVAAAMGPAFEEAQGELARMGKAAEDLDYSLLVLGKRASPELRAQAVSTRKQVNGQYLQVQRHVDLLAEDTGNTFTTALESALIDAGEGFAVKECGGGSGGMARMMGRAGPSCTGKDLNPALAKALDADPKLQAAATEIREVPWPALGVEGEAVTPVALTGTSSWVDGGALVRHTMRRALDGAEADLERALEPFEEELDARDPATVEKAATFRAAYEAKVAAHGDTLLTAVVASLEKSGAKAGLGEVGLCPNPAAFGGCTGTDRTRDVLQHLEDDKRFQKAIADLK